MGFRKNYVIDLGFILFFYQNTPLAKESELKKLPLNVWGMYCRNSYGNNNNNCFFVRPWHLWSGVVFTYTLLNIRCVDLNHFAETKGD